jgi:hypothetical protein
MTSFAKNVGAPATRCAGGALLHRVQALLQAVRLDEAKGTEATWTSARARSTRPRSPVSRPSNIPTA